MQQQKYRRKGYQPNIYLREWAIKTELKYRARIYDPLEREQEQDHKSIAADEPVTSQPKATAAVAGEVVGYNAGDADPVANGDDDGEALRTEATIEEEDENKGSLAYFSNQMVMSIGADPAGEIVPLNANRLFLPRPQDQTIFRLKFPANHRTCNITKWLYPIVKEKRRRLLGPIQSPYMLEQILQNAQIHEKSPKNQRCIGSILRHLRMTRKWHHNNVVPYLMANLWDNL